MVKWIICLFTITAAIHYSVAAQLSRQQLIFKDPPFQQCHASSVVKLKSGKILVVCFGGTGEGKPDVGIWLSEMKNNEWTEPKNVANGLINDSLRYPCWNPVLFQSQSRKLFLFYKVGPSPTKWWGMVKTSEDEGLTWSAPRCLPKNILGPIKNKPIQLVDGTILSPSSIEEPEYWRSHIEKSTDDGNTWEKITVDTSRTFNTIQPSIIQHADGRLQMLCRSKEGYVIQSWSDEKGDKWTDFSATELPNPNSGTDAITLPDGRHLIVYNPDLPGRDWWEGRTSLSIAISEDGKQWKKIMDLERHKSGEYSYPAAIADKNGYVHITYTYDRRNIKYVMINSREINK